MSCLYLVNDMFARIHNAYIRRCKYVKILKSEATISIVNLLYRKGLVSNFIFSNNESHYFYIELKYHFHKPVFSFLLKSSKISSPKLYFSSIKRMDTNKQQMYLIRNSFYGYILSPDMLINGKFLGGQILAVITVNNI